MSGHTPGPWAVEGPDECGDYAIHQVGIPLAIAAVVQNGLRPAEVTKANADLIASLPALVAERDALLAAIDWACGEKPDRDGKWFGEHEPQYSYDKLKRPYWWRTRLRELAALSPSHVEGK